ncbi:hypothetical protein ACE10Z_30155 [Bradyrhizobium sp. Pha-3]|uniref:hypothetical protein n=1 Tax=Bradyrhizobium sp. Pha-3 TaxID=208375 RepID=UPI0035D51433
MFRAVVLVSLLLISLAKGAAAQSCAGLTTIVNGTNADATVVMGNFTALQNCINSLAMPRGYLNGLTLSTAGSSVSFSVAVGAAASDDTAPVPMKLTTLITKTTNVWAVGTGNGALDAGAIAANTWYHVFLIERTDTGGVDVLASLSATSPTLPTNYTAKRRIGSMKTNASAQWTAFTQIGNEFWLASPALDYDQAISTTNTDVTATLSSVPSGVQVKALANVTAFSNTAIDLQIYVRSPFVSSQNSSWSVSPGVTIYDNSSGGGAVGNLALWTNAAQQLVFNNSLPIAHIRFFTLGWVDPRGRD